MGGCTSPDIPKYEPFSLSMPSGFPKVDVIREPSWILMGREVLSVAPGTRKGSGITLTRKGSKHLCLLCSSISSDLAPKCRLRSMSA